MVIMEEDEDWEISLERTNICGKKDLFLSICFFLIVDNGLHCVLHPVVLKE